MLNDPNSHGLGMMPMVKAPESAMQPGMSTPVGRPLGFLARPVGELFLHRGAVMRQEADGSATVVVPDPPTPNYWTYDFNPGTGSARATYTGETALVGSATLNGSPLVNAAGAVASYNGRVGAVTGQASDVSPFAVTTFNTRGPGAVTLTLADLVAAGIPAQTPNYLSGFGMSTAGASITMSIAAGSCCNSTNVDYINVAALNKTTAAWALGNAVGGLDTGAIAANTWYKFYSIKRPDTGVTDYAFTVNALATGPTTGGNIPAAYTEFRYIGSWKTNGASQWASIIQRGDWYQWITPVNDISTGASPGQNSTRTLPSVPTGLNVQAWCEVCITDVSTNVVASDVWISDPSVSTSLLPSNTSGGSQRSFTAAATTNNWQYGHNTWAFTNTVQQVVLSISNGGSANVSATIVVMAWVDTRGK